MNLIAGTVDVAGASGLFSFKEGSLQLACPAVKEALLGLRPEHLHLRADAPWRGEVVLVEPTGADTFVVLKTAVGLITARVAPQTAVKVGDSTGLDVSDAHANWFDAPSGERLA